MRHSKACYFLYLQSELFQEDLYPDTPGDIPAVSAEEWWEGVSKEPILMSLKGWVLFLS